MSEGGRRRDVIACCLRVVALLGLAAGAGAALAPPLPDDLLAQLRREGVLRWGADQEGGGPFVYPREDDPDTVTGFEVEIAEALAARLGVVARFTQGQWDRLPDMLRTRKIHVVLNGYELTEPRRQVMLASRPYYVYGLQLLVRSDDAGLRSWDDLLRPRAGSPRRVGVLTGSAADDYASEHCAAVCEVVRYDGNTDAMREVETGKLDATLQDTPIASFYASRFPGLRPLGEPVAPGTYVMYVAAGETALHAALDEALAGLIRDGGLEAILRRYGLWNAQQEQLAAGGATGELRAVSPGGPAFVTLGERPRGWAVVRDYGGVLLRSAGLTVVLAVLSFPLAIALGLLVALGRLYGSRWLRWPLAAYVELLRGTPLMLQLYCVFFLLPEVGINVPAFWTAVLGLAINYSAYEAEIYRAGLQAVPPGQMEAALALGMSRGQALRRIVVPQAVRIVIPPVVNDFIALFKDTSVCSVVTLVELTKRFSVLSMSTQATVELMLLTAALYMAMSYPLARLARRIETHLDRGGAQGTGGSSARGGSGGGIDGGTRASSKTSGQEAPA